MLVLDEVEEFVVLLQRVPVSHPGDIVANNPLNRNVRSARSRRLSEKDRLGDVKVKELFDDFPGYCVSPFYDRMLVQIGVKELPKLVHGFGHFRAKPDQSDGAVSGLVCRPDVVLRDQPRAVGGQVGHQKVDEVTDTVKYANLAVEGGVSLTKLKVDPSPEFRFGEVLVRKKIGGEAVVNVVRVVSDLVGGINDLGFETGKSAQTLDVEVRERARITMLDDPLSHLPGKVESVEIRVFFLQNVHNAKALDVVLKTAILCHQLVEGRFTGVSEGRVTHIVSQGDGFSQVLVQSEDSCNRAPDAGDLHSMRQAGPVMIALVIEEHLGLVFQAAEGPAVDDPVPVPLVHGSEVMLLFWVDAAP